MKYLRHNILYAMLCGIILTCSTDTMAEYAPTRSSLRVPEALTLRSRKPRPVQLSTDVSRARLGVDDAHTPTGLQDDQIPFTGKGVVIGVIDAGIDPRHPAFTDNDDQSRVALYITTTSAAESEDNTIGYQVFKPSQGDFPSDAEVDDSHQGHGTHTSGTAAGRNVGVPYYGMAPDATLVLTSMGDALYDDEILLGMSAAIDYATEHDMPCVLSLSLGSSAGMHDGSGYMADFLADSLPSEGMAVCFAAGNDGTNPVSLYRDFGVDTRPLRTAFYRGGVGVHPSAVHAFFTSEAGMQIAFTLVQIGPDKWGEVWCSPYYNIDELTAEGTDILSSLQPIAEALSADAAIELYRHQSTSDTEGVEILAYLPWKEQEKQYTIGVSITHTGHAEVYGYSSFSSAFGAFGIDGYTKGDGTQSISDYCTGENVIAVGATNARTSFVDQDGATHTYDPSEWGPLYTVGTYSSHGTKPEILPHTVAPGTDVIAPLSLTSDYTRVANIKGTDGKHWYWGATSGTSMATPTIAGIIALWLQACPTLTRSQILSLLERSSATNDMEHTRWGEPSAYKGLQLILQEQSSLLTPGVMPDTSTHAPTELMVRYLSDSNVEATLPFAAYGGLYTAYSIDGKIVAHGAFDGVSFRLSLPTPGIYILKAETPRGNASQKIKVR